MILNVDDEQPESLFSYGTLQSETVQLATFGRVLRSRSDALDGYRIVTIEIDDHDFIVTSGTAHHRTLHFTGNATDTVEGNVLSLTHRELTLADSYEPSSYQRIQVQLRSGSSAWVYISSNSR